MRLINLSTTRCTNILSLLCKRLDANQVLQPFFPKVDWEPLEEFPVTDRGLFADPEKKALLGAASKVVNLTPTIGTILEGVDLRQLSDTQKDEL